MIPEWWTDVHRSLEQAINDFGRVLRTIETALEHPDGKVMTTDVLIDAGNRLSRVMKLSERRLEDASDADKAGIPFDEYRRSARREFLRCREIESKVRMRLERISNEIRQTKNRGPNKRIFRPATPSHIDLRL